MRQEPFTGAETAIRGEHMTSRLLQLSVASAVFVLWTTFGWAQETPPSAAPADSGEKPAEKADMAPAVDALQKAKEKMEAEKAQKAAAFPSSPIAAPAPAPPAKDDAAELSDLEDLEELEELESMNDAELAVEEQLKFFELDGYFRVRTDLFHRLDLGIYNELRPLGDLGTADHTSNIKKKDNTLGSANMRLRLSPTLNVSEDIKIKMDFDLLDNVVMGSTPDTFLRGGSGGLAPGIAAFSTAQVPPQSGRNSDVDSIQVRHVWAEVRTPIGVLKFGRQPSHWGTGMYINDGSCLDCDYGDSVDRILFGTKVFEHILFVNMDFVNEGVTDDTSFEYRGQDKDATQLDDTQQIGFGFARKHSDAEAEELLENDDWILDYGMINVFRWQSYSLEQSVIGDYDTFGGQPPAGDFASRQTLRSQLIQRDLNLYIGDIWARFLYKRLHIEFEAAFLVGALGDAAKDAAEQKSLRAKGITDNSVDINQYGFVLQIDYKFLDDALFVGAEWGWASGDPYHGESYDTGFGVYPYQNRQFADAKYQRTKYGPMIEDRAVTNFRFDPDYHVDLILFREIIGTVTDATYLKPTVQYNITPSIGLRLDGILSWALEPDSTPSYYHMKFENMEDVKSGLPVKRKTSSFLGWELDLELFYKSFDGFGSGLQYGVFFPGSAFGYWDPDYIDKNGNRSPTWFNAPNIAQTLQWRLTVEF